MSSTTRSGGEPIASGPTLERLSGNRSQASRSEDQTLRIERVAAIMRLVLNLRPEESSALATRWWCRVLEIRSSWERAARMETDEAVERSKEFEGIQLDSLRDLVASEPRGLVLATIHMGDYLTALLAIARSLRGRPFTIVRRREVSPRDANVFGKLERLGLDVEVIVTSERSATMRLARRLRSGSAAILFFDLHSGFGKAQPVEFLGQQVQWVEGPVRMAAACNAILVPFAATKNPETGSNQLHVDSAVEFARPHVSAAERSAVLRWLAAFAETQVRLHPDQWLHWSQFPRMASMSEPSSA